MVPHNVAVCLYFRSARAPLFSRNSRATRSLRSKLHVDAKRPPSGVWGSAPRRSRCRLPLPLPLPFRWPQRRHENCILNYCMIHLTRLDNSELLVNALLIERVEAMPDTVVTLTTGRKILVCEPPEEVVQKTVAYLHSLRAPGDDPEAVINIAQVGRVTR